MEYIDKKSETTANAIIDAYLKSECHTGISEHLVYDDFSSHNGKYKLIDEVLLPEQENRCCYCMGRIDDHQNATIEHVIPKSITDPKEFSKYFNTRAKNYLNKKNLCLTCNFVKNLTPFPPYPHAMAYYNFSIACTDCNNHRDCQYIDPLFFYPNVKSEVRYDKQTGEMNWSADPVLSAPNNFDLPTIEKVGLNAPLMKAIRCVWFYAKKNNIDLNELVDEEQKAGLLYEVVGKVLTAGSPFNDDNLNAFINIQAQRYWNKLLKYDYFGTI